MINKIIDYPVETHPVDDNSDIETQLVENVVLLKGLAFFLSWVSMV